MLELPRQAARLQVEVLAFISVYSPGVVDLAARAGFANASPPCLGHGHASTCACCGACNTCRTDGVKAAAKVAEIEHVEQLHIFSNEINILAMCSECRNVTKFLASYYHNEKLWIVIEVCDAGSLSDIIDKNKRGMNESEVRWRQSQCLLSCPDADVVKSFLLLPGEEKERVGAICLAFLADLLGTARRTTQDAHYV